MSWREKWAPQIAQVIKDLGPGKTSAEVKAALKAVGPGWPPKTHPSKIWGNEAARQLRDYLAGRSPRPFTKKATLQPVSPQQQSLF